MSDVVEPDNMMTHSNVNIHLEADVTSSTKNTYDACNSLNPNRTSVLMYVCQGVEASIVFSSVVLNVVIIIAVCSNKRLYTVPHVFIASLAVSDILASCVFEISEITILKEGICYLPAIFKSARAFMLSCGVISNLSNHLIISVERWLFIAQPFLHQRIVTRRSTACSLILVWLFSMVVNVNWVINSPGSLAIAVSANIGVVRPAFHFFLSLAMFSIYLHIAIITRQAIKKINRTRPLGVINGSQGNNKPRKSIRTFWKNIRMLVIVFGTFFLFMTPGVCVDIYAYTVGKSLYHTVVGKVVDLAWSVHCCCNFCVCAAQDSVFKDVLKQAFIKFGDPVLQRLHKSAHPVIKERQI